MNKYIVVSDLFFNKHLFSVHPSVEGEDLIESEIVNELMKNQGIYANIQLNYFEINNTNPQAMNNFEIEHDIDVSLIDTSRHIQFLKSVR